jgi:hypothetical protein
MPIPTDFYANTVRALMPSVEEVVVELAKKSAKEGKLYVVIPKHIIARPSTTGQDNMFDWSGFTSRGFMIEFRFDLDTREQQTVLRW